MHIPDGFVDVPVSLAAWGVAAGAVGLALRGARRELDERTAPLAGLTAAFVFAAQMINFPVGAGTSGHLLGAALAAVLVGPWTAVLVLTVVLSVQALLFADGGVLALGLNLTNMAVVGVLVAWLVVAGLGRVLPRTRWSVLLATGVAAFLAVPAAALAFVLEYWLGGTTEVPIGAVLAAMGGVHLLIGIGEAVITVLTVGAVLAVRPDLVHAARGLGARTLELRPVTVAVPAGAGGAGATGADATAGGAAVPGAGGACGATHPSTVPGA